jgi:hypothetical protein
VKFSLALISADIALLDEGVIVRRALDKAVLEAPMRQDMGYCCVFLS